MTESNALTTTFAAGLENVSLTPAIMEMIQRTSRKVTDPQAYGKLRDSLTGDLYTRLHVVPLSISGPRVYFAPGSDFGSDPLCRSDDGITPCSNVIAQQSDLCSTCANSQWGPNGQRPDCNEQRRILFITKDDGLPYTIQVQGTSISPVTALTKGIYRQCISARNRGINLNLYDFELDLVPTSVEGARGIYYVLKYENIKQVANPGEFGPMYEAFIRKAQQQNRPVHALAEESATPDNDQPYTPA